MNKNLLLIAAAAAAYALLRPKTTVTNTTASAGAGAGTSANTYVQQQAAAGTTTSGNPAGGWLNTAGNIITGATGLIQTGSTAWGDVKGALGIKPPVKAPTAPATASITAEGDGAIWAGPNYQTNVWAGPKYEES